MSFAVALPQEWTHDRVLERIGRGLKALVLSTGRLGPKTYGSLWPSVVRDLPPLAELEQWLELRRDFEAAVQAAFERPSAEDVMLADEALAWPARYLGDAPLERDAVWLTARCIGLSSKLEKILRDRRKVADFMVEQRKQNAPDIIRIYEDDAENAAAKIVAWANSAFDNPPARSMNGRPPTRQEERMRIARIRKGARILFVREIQAVKAVERHTFVRRCDVMPGKLFNQSRVHHHRIAGVGAILAGLEADSVKVR